MAGSSISSPARVTSQGMPSGRAGAFANLRRQNQRPSSCTGRPVTVLAGEQGKLTFILHRQAGQQAPLPRLHFKAAIYTDSGMS